MKYKFLLCFLIFSSISFGQTDSTKHPLSKIELGGNMSFAFGQETYIGVSPLLGYRIFDRVLVSAGGIYRYASIKSGFLTYKTHTTGWRTNLKIDVAPPLFIIGEYQNLSLDGWDYSVGKPGRVNPDILFVGLGYNQKLSKRTYMSMSMLLDTLKDVNNPYPFPYFRGGISWKLKA